MNTLTFLAESNTTSIGQWGMFIVMVLGAVGALVLKFIDNKKENLAQQIQIEQRDCMRAVEKATTIQNGKLSEVLAVNEAHHAELIRTLNTTCKASCINFQASIKLPDNHGAK
jgi:homoserine dehydrogenase